MHVFIYLFIYCDRRMRGQQLRFMRSFLLLLKAEGREKSRRLSVAVSQMPQKVQPFYYLLLCVAQIYRMINLGTSTVYNMLHPWLEKWNAKVIVVAFRRKPLSCPSRGSSCWWEERKAVQAQISLWDANNKKLLAFGNPTPVFSIGQKTCKYFHSQQVAYLLIPVVNNALFLLC